MLSLIAAVDDGGTIGAGGKIPWHLPADFKHFKELTMGHPIIMGRKTYESIGKPLPGRINIVMTSDANYKAEGCVVAGSLGEAIRIAEDRLAGDSGEVFVIGGAQVYALALPKAETVYLTRVHGTFKGDAAFPPLDEGRWQLVRAEPHGKDEKNPLDYEFQVWKKK